MISTFFPEQEQLFRERTGKDFSFFYEKYYPKLIYYTSRMCNDQQKAQDISTDSFLIAFEKIDKYEKETQLTATYKLKGTYDHISTYITCKFIIPVVCQSFHLCLFSMPPYLYRCWR